MRVPRWFHRPTTARVGGGAFHAVESPAAGWVGHIEDDGLPFERRAAAANLALRDDPGCIEAHAFLAAHAEDPDLARLHLVKALRTGQAFWEPVAREQPDFAWWSVAATRHYMRALKQLGDLLAGLGDAHTAGICYRKLLEMNPRDNQGVRSIVRRAPGAEPEAAAEGPRM